MTVKPPWQENKVEWRDGTPSNATPPAPPETRKKPTRPFSNLRLSRVPYSGVNGDVVVTGKCCGQPFRRVLDKCAADLLAMPRAERHRKVHQMLADADDLELEGDELLPDDPQEDEDEFEDEDENG